MKDLIRTCSCIHVLQETPHLTADIQLRLLLSSILFNVLSAAVDRGLARGEVLEKLC